MLLLLAVTLITGALVPAIAGPSKTTDDVAKAWLRFSPHSSYVCTRSPDATFHILGGPHQRPSASSLAVTVAARDMMCPIGAATALGASGEVFHVQFGSKTQNPSPDGAQADALALVRIGSGTCWLDSAGALTCREPRTYTQAAEAAKVMSALGPIAEMLPVVPHGLSHNETCARYRDGRVVCAMLADKVYVFPPLWTDAVQASVFLSSQNTFGGCAVLVSGRVSCIGNNRLGLHGKIGDVTGASLVPGLTNIDEVQTTGGHACARAKGHVWCWGHATGYQTGGKSRGAAKPIPQCPIDQERTRTELARYNAAVDACAKAPANDRCHREIENSRPPPPVFKETGTCTTMKGELFNERPMLVDSVEGAVAIGLRGGSSCALTAKEVVCWGYEQPTLFRTPL